MTAPAVMALRIMRCSARKTTIAGTTEIRHAAASTCVEVAVIVPSKLNMPTPIGISLVSVSKRNGIRNCDQPAMTVMMKTEATPGVDQISQSFQIIFLLYGLVVPFVTGLFFLIVTFQKAGALTLLRAIGAPARRLVDALLVQVVAVVLLGVAVGTALFAPLSPRSLGGLPLSFDPAAVAFWAVLLLVLSTLSALFAARRVLAIDPVEATTGAGVRP